MHLSVPSYFLWGDTPLYGFTTICLFIHQLDIWVVPWTEDTSASESLEPVKITLTWQNMWLRRERRNLS